MVFLSFLGGKWSRGWIFFIIIIFFFVPCVWLKFPENQFGSPERKKMYESKSHNWTRISEVGFPYFASFVLVSWWSNWNYVLLAFLVLKLRHLLQTICRWWFLHWNSSLRDLSSTWNFFYHISKLEVWNSSF